MALFDVQHIGFSQGATPIVRDICLSIEKGTVTGFLGRSGCGKTTLIKLIAGILVPTSGKAFFENHDIQTMSKDRNLDFRRRCSFVFQDAALWANQTILQNLQLPLKIHYPKLTPEEVESEIMAACALVNFNRPLHLRPADLSAGEQKKVALARAFITKPEILFLDEVTAALDVSSCELVISLLKDFQSKGNTIVYVSHNNEFIKNFQDTLHIIEDGCYKSTRTGLWTNIDTLMDAIESPVGEDHEV